MLWALLTGRLEKVKVQAGEYVEITGIWVAALLLLGSIGLFGLSALWASRQSTAVSSRAA
jgi:hypothetical protein